jgi:hypothetical protein
VGPQWGEGADGGPALLLWCGAALVFGWGGAAKAGCQRPPRSCIARAAHAGVPAIAHAHDGKSGGHGLHNRGC